MQAYGKQFKLSIIWYTLSSLLTQGFLLIHHILLRNMSFEFHGNFGCSLSLFYFLIAVSNLGLNTALISFFNQYSLSRSNLNKLILTQFIPQIIILTLSSVTIYKIFSLLNSFSYEFLLIISICFFLESIRMFLSYFLKLAFFYRITTISEILGIILYSIYIYVIANKISIYSLWYGHLANSLIQVIILLVAFIVFYYRLPKHNSNNIKEIRAPNPLTVWKTRISTTFIQISSQVFSGNFLVPVCAYYIGLDAASLLKILASFIRWINIIFQKIFGISAGAVFAHIKNYNIKAKAKIFNKINNNLIYIILGLIIFISINNKKLLSNSLITSIIILFILENFFILYEKWFILEEKAYYLLFANLANLILILAFLVCFNTSSLTQLLLIVLSFRIFIFILLAFFAYLKWKIKPNFNINYKVILTFTIISLLFLIII